ncbi:hypothetical protein [Desulfosporosinus sp. BG]|uniref:hypothetical protein n=1 Tax=Desulfosporosinus sp. BG TaxID=1633135 RepID=UPI00083A237B|nr:hypothetical protein [Desulfosporosinus sp. BG]ODA41852.1 hypothetical protein DSBG_1344 [Desulfosporosinus sp. BG]
MSTFAVIDTETTWGDEVMSIGVVIADSEIFELVDKRYYILTPFKNHGGMYAYALYINGIKPDLECSREMVMTELVRFLAAYKVETMFAYNASFDYRHLPELSYLVWYDIMKMAAYRQHNPKIPCRAECHGTGRLKRGYGVESVYRMLSEDLVYCEMHNALTDAIDELEIMRLLNHELGKYVSARIG